MVSKRRVFVAGHSGMVGSAICRLLQRDASVELVTKSRHELDLTNQAQVRDFFSATSVDEVYLAAAKVGGIYANSTYPADFIYENLMIEANVIHYAYSAGVKKLLFLGSSCIYPRDAEQPMRESALLSGKLEPTNEPYAVAKITGIKLCESYSRQYAAAQGVDYRCVMRTNLYGPGDNYHPDNSHVIPALIRRFHEAKLAADPFVTVWGSGSPRREFLFVDDMAQACLHIMGADREVYEGNTEPMCRHINIGSGTDITIAELAAAVQQVTGYGGNVKFDPARPDGSPQKLMSSDVVNSMGWRATVGLMDGLSRTYEDFKLRCLQS